MLIDEAFITIIAGKGGAGNVSFFPGLKSGPSGGTGGKGADVIRKFGPNSEVPTSPVIVAVTEVPTDNRIPKSKLNVSGLFVGLMIVRPKNNSPSPFVKSGIVLE